MKDNSRIQSLDALRGFCIILVIAYHLGYNLVAREILPREALYNPLLGVLQPFFAGVFIALAGVSSRFSRNNFKRGLVLLGCAALVTVVSFAPLPDPWLTVRTVFGHEPTGAEIGELVESGKIVLHKDILTNAERRGITEPENLGAFALSSYKTPYSLIGAPILFGILHLLAACILLYALLSRLRMAAPAVFLGAFFVLWFGVTRWPVFPSVDYFPLLPWGFVFAFGVWLGGPIRDGVFPSWFYAAKIPVFPAVGRRTLLIYLLHQPVLYGLLWLFWG
ncbi:MAG: DUF1624 domain-containing protein [Oscillospiraceae bacterium]|nr:DUF1624 domain-containing protein [Oscillospiraceae bacterium]